MVTSRNNSRTTVAPGSRRLPLCPGGRRLAGPDRLPPGWAAGRGQRRDRLLAAAALGQLDAGADLVKLYLDGPDGDSSPFHRRRGPPHRRGGPCPRGHGDRHSSLLPGARAGVAAGWMPWSTGSGWRPTWPGSWPPLGTALVATLAVLESWASFGATTRLGRLCLGRGRAGLAERRAAAHESVRLAHAAGVLLGAGTDFGGGWLRANQLPWEGETLVAAGLEPYDALAAATVNGGRLLGEPGAGVLAQGGPADFLLVHGDPLSDPGSLWRVWRTGW
jgi:hypothetical protein